MSKLTHNPKGSSKTSATPFAAGAGWGSRAQARLCEQGTAPGLPGTPRPSAQRQASGEAPAARSAPRAAASLLPLPAAASAAAATAAAAAATPWGFQKGGGRCRRPSPAGRLGRARGSAAPAGVTLRPGSGRRDPALGGRRGTAGCLAPPAPLRGCGLPSEFTVPPAIQPSLSKRTLTRRSRARLGKLDEVWGRFLLAERCCHTQYWCGARQALRGQPRPRTPPFQREAEHGEVTGG